MTILPENVHLVFYNRLTKYLFPKYKNHVGVIERVYNQDNTSTLKVFRFRTDKHDNFINQFEFGINSNFNKVLGKKTLVQGNPWQITVSNKEADEILQIGKRDFEKLNTIFQNHFINSTFPEFITKKKDFPFFNSVDITKITQKSTALFSKLYDIKDDEKQININKETINSFNNFISNNTNSSTYLSELQKDPNISKKNFLDSVTKIRKVDNTFEKQNYEFDKYKIKQIIDD